MPWWFVFKNYLPFTKDRLSECGVFAVKLVHTSITRLCNHVSLFFFFSCQEARQMNTSLSIRDCGWFTVNGTFSKPNPTWALILINDRAVSRGWDIPAGCSLQNAHVLNSFALLAYVLASFGQYSSEVGRRTFVSRSLSESFVSRKKKMTLVMGWEQTTKESLFIFKEPTSFCSMFAESWQRTRHEREEGLGGEPHGSGHCGHDIGRWAWEGPSWYQKKLREYPCLNIKGKGNVFMLPPRKCVSRFSISTCISSK